MSRRLRRIDDAAAIREWIETMNAILCLVDLVAKNSEEHVDGWKPWRHQAQVPSNNGMREHDNHESMENSKQQKIEHTPKTSHSQASTC